MIEFENNTFYLSGKNYSYIFFVNEYGFLEQLYYGKKLPGRENLDYAAMREIRSFSPYIGEARNRNFSHDLVKEEYPSFQRGDYRVPALICRFGNGAGIYELTYEGYEVKNGEIEVEGMPHARYGGQTLIITLSDKRENLTVKLNYVVYDDSDVLIRNAEIINGEQGEIELNRAFSFSEDLTDGRYELLRLEGAHLRERTPERIPLGHGITEMGSYRGTSSHQLNPFIALLEKHTTETSGTVYAFGLIYSGSFSLKTEKDQFDNVRVTGGISDVGFFWKLKSGERFVTPQAILVYSACGLGHMSRELSDFHRRHIISSDKVFSARPVVIDNWEATYYDFDNQKLCALVEKASEIGVDTLVLDDGWFGKRDGDKDSLGDWYINTDKLKGGFSTIINKCKKCGMKFGLWFEPEMISENSEMFRKHPDWAIAEDGRRPCEGRNEYVLDFSKDEVVDAVYFQMEKILSEYDITYVKWDMNRHLSDCFSHALPADRQGELAHRYMLGVYKLADRLTNRFKNVLFEGCSGGGGRFDSGMLYYFPQIWTSDNTEAHERTIIQYGTSLAYPLSSMICHVSASPNQQTGRCTPGFTRGAIAGLGSFGFEVDFSKCSSEELKEMKGMIAAYKEISPLILRGELFRLKNPLEDEMFGFCVVSQDKREAYAVVETGLRRANIRTPYIKFDGLEATARYRVKERDKILYGATLMNLGLPFFSAGDFSVNIFRFERID